MNTLKRRTNTAFEAVYDYCAEQLDILVDNCDQNLRGFVDFLKTVDTARLFHLFLIWWLFGFRAMFSNVLATGDLLLSLFFYYFAPPVYFFLRQSILEMNDGMEYMKTAFGFDTNNTETVVLLKNEVFVFDEAIYLWMTVVFYSVLVFSLLLSFVGNVVEHRISKGEMRINRSVLSKLK